MERSWTWRPVALEDGPVLAGAPGPHLVRERLGPLLLLGVPGGALGHKLHLLLQGVIV